jgi:hypothetical protein
MVFGFDFGLIFFVFGNWFRFRFWILVFFLVLVLVLFGFGLGLGFRSSYFIDANC